VRVSVRLQFRVRVSVGMKLVCAVTQRGYKC
jgi:hypothetical protein